MIVNYFNSTNIQQAEDLVQETLIAALNNWCTKGVPDNPSAWLFQVAKRKALNEIQRQNRINRHHKSKELLAPENEPPEDLFMDDEIRDSQLRMIFTCCHPSIDTSDQVALILKVLCGFGVKEIAKALLTTESAISKRLYRAKEKIRASTIPLSIPQGKILTEKLKTVSLTLYLLFNEGYKTSHGDALIQKELCMEAIRLNKLLIDQFDDQRSLMALMALMCFHTARFDARIDHHGTIILFEDQNRALWNRELINRGFLYFQKSLGGPELSSYHIEARIAAEHCIAPSFEQTNWQLIHEQYELLDSLNPNPIIRLNLIIIKSKLKGPAFALKKLDQLANEQDLNRYYLFAVTRGVFSMELKNYHQAIHYFQYSLTLSPSIKECAFIEERIMQCKKKLPDCAGST